MYSQCERCGTVFMVAPADLAAARGDVVCGQCGTLFNALLSLSEFPLEPEQQQLQTHQGARLAPMLQMPVGAPIRSAISVFDPDQNGEIESTHFPAPEFRVTAASRNWPWWVSAIALLVVLIAQIGWGERTRWIDNSRWRAAMERVCLVAGCEMPLPSDPSRLALTAREVRPHPSVADALLITATVRNDADFAQPFPALRVRLSDLQEQRIASRRFDPADYLADAGDDIRGLAAHASAVIVLEVADPGRDAVAFEFAFE